MEPLVGKYPGTGEGANVAFRSAATPDQNTELLSPHPSL